MYYEINVSKDGKHLFATNRRSAITADELLIIFDIFVLKFPEEEGFKMLVNYHEERGIGIPQEVLTSREQLWEFVGLARIR